MSELRKYRRIAGLTQEQLADRSGVDATLISRMEREPYWEKPGYLTVTSLARALNLEPEELFQAHRRRESSSTTPAPEATT
jgi:transcriptional regulator with XRE-family HTH domain